MAELVCKSRTRNSSPDCR